MRNFLLTLLLLLLSTGYGISQQGKSVSILGDSYSTFEGYLQPDTNYVWYYSIPAPNENTDVTAVEQTWWHQFIRKNDYSLCMNNSFSGSTICNTGYRNEDYTDRSFITRMSNLGTPDIIFIFGGTNDTWANAPIGQYSYSDWSSEELYAFRPAMAYMLDYLKSQHPDSEIYFLLNSELKEEINESVKTVCLHYQIACIELQGIAKQRNHPSVKGMEQIYQQIELFLSQKEN